MTAAPETRASLVFRLRDPADTDAWREFVRLYASLIYGFARRRGLQDADAADLMQDVLRSVAGAIGRLEYDRGKGTFRGWLFSITRNKVFNFLDSARRRPRGNGSLENGQGLDDLPAPLPDEDDWDREYERKVFAWAAERIRNEFQPSTWKAFWKTAVDGAGAAETGEQLGMTPGAVYVAKSRVLARLRQEIEQIEDA